MKAISASALAEHELDPRVHIPHPNRPAPVFDPIRASLWKQDADAARSAWRGPRKLPPRPPGSPVYAVADPESGTKRIDFRSLAEAAEAFGINKNTISWALKAGGKAGGRYWRYANIPEAQQPPLKIGYMRAVIVRGTQFKNIPDAMDKLKIGRRQIDRLMTIGKAWYADGKPGTRAKRNIEGNTR